MTRAGCHSCASNVARPPPRAKKWTLHRQQPLSVSHSLFLFACMPPSSSFPELSHFTGSCHNVVSAYQGRDPPNAPPKSNRLMGRDFLYVSQKSSKLEQEFVFLSCCNCTKKITTTTSYKEINPTKQISKSRIPLTTADNREQYRSTDPAREAVASLVVFHELHLLFLNHIRLLSLIRNKMCDTMSGAKLLKYRLT